jgi:hypothetical protein
MLYAIANSMESMVNGRYTARALLCEQRKRISRYLICDPPSRCTIALTIKL